MKMFIKLEVYYSSKIYDYTTNNFYPHQRFSHHRQPSSECVNVLYHDVPVYCVTVLYHDVPVCCVCDQCVVWVCGIMMYTCSALYQLAVIMECCLFQATAEANNLAAVAGAKHAYVKEMEQVSTPAAI